MLRKKSLTLSGWVQRCAAVVCLGVLSASASPGASTDAAAQDHKQPMHFSWNTEGPAGSCEPNCRSWVAAVGVITADTEQAFDDFARDRELRGTTIVLDSGGGSVLDAVALGRRWRALGVSTTVGRTVALADAAPSRATIAPDAYCESMCVFLLLSGVNRYVPPTAHVRVHQIWMGDRAADAEAASYTAQDLMIIQRDIGRLANYTFEMGGNGALLALALSVPPWQALHELSPDEVRQTNVGSAATLAAVLPYPKSIAKPVSEPDTRPMAQISIPNTAADAAAIAGLGPKPMQDRVMPDRTKTAEALPRNGNAAAGQ